MRTLYTTPDCPVCKLIKRKMDENGIEYEVCMDTETMQQKGIKSVPVMEQDGILYNALKIMTMINEGALA